MLDLAEGMKGKWWYRSLFWKFQLAVVSLGVVNTLGEPIDGKGAVEHDGFSPVEMIAPGVIDRQSQSTNLYRRVINPLTP